jgi:hypothetical protein
LDLAQFLADPERIDGNHNFAPVPGGTGATGKIGLNEPRNLDAFRPEPAARAAPAVEPATEMQNNATIRLNMAQSSPWRDISKKDAILTLACRERLLA